MGLRLLLTLVIGVVVFALVYWQRPLNEEAYLGSNLVVFALVNLNIALLCVLLFLVGRNLAKVFLDRRKGILGSKLRLRLVLAFVVLTLVPSTILVFLASGLLTRATEGWFSSPADVSVDGALTLARIYAEELQQGTLTVARTIAEDMQAQQFSLQNIALLRNYLDNERKKRDLFEMLLIDSEGEAVIRVQNAAASIEHFQPPAPSPVHLRRAIAGSETSLEETESGQFARAYTSLVWSGTRYVLVVTRRLRPELVHSLALIKGSYAEYEQLKLFKHPLKSTYLLILYMFTGLILFAAIWVGMYIARELSIPLQRLAEGTKEVAKGNYAFRIRQVGDDEIGSLIRSFNTMTADLRISQEQSERRRLYIETILSHLAVGVIAIDRSHRISSCNSSARRLFRQGEEAGLLGSQLEDVLPAVVVDEIAPVLFSVERDPDDEESLEREFPLVVEGQERKVLCTAGPLRDASGAWIGTLLLFDDITALSQAQQIAAWREAARRIAHEIKNPLTPVQLAAQRIQKIAQQSPNSPPAIVDSAEAIVTHVHSIKRLADEFSRFARMPSAEFEPTDLNVIISQILPDYIDKCPEVLFQVIAEPTLPQVLLDREQIRRVLMNLLDNSLAVLTETGRDDQLQGRAKILIRTTYNSRKQRVGLEVSDNGPGIPDRDKVRIFQPYFTGREQGTGLGLAIVASILAEHQGDIRIYDNQPHGAKFVVELPLVPRASSVRKLSSEASTS